MVDLVVDPSVTTGPIEGSRKYYRDLEGVRGARVPFRRVHLSNGEHFDLYDTSGPYTDPHAAIDLHAGLAGRPGVVRDRARSCSGRGPARSPRRWRSSPRVKPCPPNWCVTKWPTAAR
jgi:hypothetical protein